MCGEKQIWKLARCKDLKHENWNVVSFEILETLAQTIHEHTPSLSP